MKKLKSRVLFAMMAAGIAFPLQAQNWMLTGNSATTAHFLGTTNANPLIFRTNNTLTMCMTCSGRVGIGTSEPLSLLHVHQASRPLCRSMTDPGIGTTSADPASSSILLTNSSTGSSSLRGFKIDLTNYNVSLKNWENGTVKLLSASNGGITISPGGKVTVGGANSYNANSPYHLFVDGTLYAVGLSGNDATINHAASGDWSHALRVGINRDLTKAITVVHPVDGEVFRVMGNGTTYAKYVVSKQVKVSLSADGIFAWPDYVFAPGYRLMPLREVELFVKANRHLPEIPSQREILENGLDVAEMNAALLKKVEELTLYIIELEKRISEVEKRGGER